MGCEIGSLMFSWLALLEGGRFSSLVLLKLGCVPLGLGGDDASVAASVLSALVLLEVGTIPPLTLELGGLDPRPAGGDRLSEGGEGEAAVEAVSGSIDVLVTMVLAAGCEVSATVSLISPEVSRGAGGLNKSTSCC